MKWIPAIAPPTNLIDVAGIAFVSNSILVQTVDGQFFVAMYTKVGGIRPNWICTTTFKPIQNVQEWTHIIKD
jgi:hypothetical protein